MHLTESFSESGFIFSPFTGNEMVLMPAKSSLKLEVIFHNTENQKPIDFNVNINAVAKINFEKLVQKGIDSIKKGNLDKVVLSRLQIIDFNNLDLISTVKKLIY